MSMRVSPRKQVTSQAKPPAVLDIGRFNVQTMAAAITASAAATTCASFDWPSLGDAIGMGSIIHWRPFLKGRFS